MSKLPKINNLDLGQSTAKGNPFPLPTRKDHLQQLTVYLSKQIKGYLTLIPKKGTTEHYILYAGGNKQEFKEDKKILPEILKEFDREEIRGELVVRFETI